jgi:hypothetical protein
LALAIALHEVDEGRIAAQSPEWIDDLLEMYAAQQSPARSATGIALPPGVTLLAPHADEQGA